MANDKPNFIVFMTDDQGYGDLSCMGATDFKTPSLDKLASEGIRFTDWYTNCPVCSPARAALLTGRYPGNTGIRGILLAIGKLLGYLNLLQHWQKYYNPKDTQLLWWENGT